MRITPEMVERAVAVLHDYDGEGDNPSSDRKMCRAILTAALAVEPGGAAGGETEPVAVVTYDTEHGWLGVRWKGHPAPKVKGGDLLYLSAREPAKDVGEGVEEMRLCEQEFLTLRPNQLYRFTVAPGCEKCEGIAAVYADHDRVPEGEEPK